MNDDIAHLRHAVRIEIIEIDRMIQSLKSLKMAFVSFGEQMDKTLINQTDTKSTIDQRCAK